MAKMRGDSSPQHVPYVSGIDRDGDGYLDTYEVAVVDGGDITDAIATQDEQNYYGIKAIAELGDILIESNLPGYVGNNYTVTAEVDLATQDTPLSANLVGDNLTVTLATIGDEQATVELGNGDIEIAFSEPGTDGNANTSQVLLDLNHQDSPLVVNVAGNNLTIELATEGDDSATVDLSNGDVSVAVSEPGTGGNIYTAEIQVDLAVQYTPLSAELVGNNLLITLPTEGDTPAQIDLGVAPNYIEVVTTAVGTATNFYQARVVVAGENDAPMSASWTFPNLVVTLGTDGIGAADDTKNTLALITQEINGIPNTPFVATQFGEGSLSLPQAAANFLGGTNKVDTDESIPENIANVINSMDGMLFDTTFNGVIPVSLAEGPVAFAGGTNKANDGVNSLTLICDEINQLLNTPYSATPVGVGSLNAAEGPIQFAGGTNKLDEVANVANLVTDEINTLPEFTAVTTSTEPVQPQLQTAFAGGFDPVLGTSIDAIVDAGATGSISAKLRRLTSDVGKISNFGITARDSLLYELDLGHIFKCIYNATILAAETKYMEIQVGANPIYLYQVVTESDGPSVVVEIIEAPTFTGAGVNLPVIGANRESSFVSGVEVLNDITDIQGGTVIDVILVPGTDGHRIRGGDDGSNLFPFKLARNTSYGFKTSNNSAAQNLVTLKLVWAEVPDVVI